MEVQVWYQLALFFYRLDSTTKLSVCNKHATQLKCNRELLIISIVVHLKNNVKFSHKHSTSFQQLASELSFNNLICSEYKKVPNLRTKVAIGMASGIVGAVISMPPEVALIRMTADGRLPLDKRRNYKHVFDAMNRQSEVFRMLYVKFVIHFSSTCWHPIEPQFDVVKCYSDSELIWWQKRLI